MWCRMEEQLNAGQDFFFRIMSTGQGVTKGQSNRPIRRGRDKVEIKIPEKTKKWGPRFPRRFSSSQGTTRRKTGLMKNHTESWLGWSPDPT